MFEGLSTFAWTASPGAFWTTAAVAAALCACAARHAYRALAHQRLLEDTPTSRLRSVTQGFVELAGTARVFDGDPIISPLSMRHCCWYRYHVEERERDHRGRSDWRTVERDTSTAIFMLDDGEGVCGIDPDGAKITPSLRRIWYGNERMPWREPGTDGFLAWLAGGRYRYTEERIDVGVELLAMGHLVTHGGAAPSVAEVDVAQILRSWKADRSSLLARYDRDGDGDLSPEEWEQARTDARAEAHANSAASSVAPNVDLLSCPPGGDRPFILAATTEEALVRRKLLEGLGTSLLAFGLAICIGWALTLRLY